MEITLHFDGACEPRNPGGVATGGFVVAIDGKHAFSESRLFCSGPKATNNVAEWSALGIGLRWIHDNVKGPIESLQIFGDSQLVIRQLTREYACNKEHLQRLRNRCDELIAAINATTWKATWIPRDQNEYADRLSRAAYEQATGKKFPERNRVR